MHPLTHAQPTGWRRLLWKANQKSVVLAIGCLTIFSLMTSQLYADTIRINATIHNTSSYSVKVTVAGFKQRSVTRTLRSGESWRFAAKSNDNGLLITAVGPVNTIKARINDGGSKKIANDRRPYVIRWDRR